MEMIFNFFSLASFACLSVLEALGTPMAGEDSHWCLPCRKGCGLQLAHLIALLDLLLARAEHAEPAAASCLSPSWKQRDVGAVSAMGRRKDGGQVGPDRGRDWFIALGDREGYRNIIAS